ncbi:hypothetical protein B0H16DRAFT_1760901 [Mycena metata]|uniref:Uncharacterized protein n=1 Tax=Mycena metata TaxID=1033252 RepID=A0AAD7K3T9_9AGAR|nr:hypothetical protein B0H16DRAFT_1760901 [Mycena metata]
MALQGLRLLFSIAFLPFLLHSTLPKPLNPSLTLTVTCTILLTASGTWEDRNRRQKDLSVDVRGLSVWLHLTTETCSGRSRQLTQVYYSLCCPMFCFHLDAEELPGAKLKALEPGIAVPTKNSSSSSRINLNFGYVVRTPLPNVLPFYREYSERTETSI